MEMIKEVVPMYDLYLFNDDINTETFVVQSLVHVMDYNSILAIKLASEAHKNGKTLIDTSNKEEMVEKRDLLVAFGLNAQVCKVE